MSRFAIRPTRKHIDKPGGKPLCKRCRTARVRIGKLCYACDRQDRYLIQRAGAALRWFP